MLASAVSGELTYVVAVDAACDVLSVVGTDYVGSGREAE